MATAMRPATIMAADHIITAGRIMVAGIIIVPIRGNPTSMISRMFTSMESSLGPEGFDVLELVKGLGCLIQLF